jgi:hypothetical protein
VTLEQLDQRTVARGVLESVEDERIVLAIPGTDYRLHLVPSIDAGAITTSIGKRIRGAIHAKAMKIHPAQGGGKFIEPVYGSPRIVAGTILMIDASQRRICVDVSIPMWVSVKEDHDLGACREGDLVNFYVESGTSFTPLES